MKYLVIENRQQEIDECLYDIADFFWNNGNEVYISNNYKNKLDYQDFVKHCDWVVLLLYGNCSLVSFFVNEKNKLKREFNLDISNSNIIMLDIIIYCVYSNSIPFLHNIFHFDRLDQNELKHFISW